MTIITLVCLIFHLILFIVGVINPTIGITSPMEIGAVVLFLDQRSGCLPTLTEIRHADHDRLH
jgi:hypothetical protein